MSRLDRYSILHYRTILYPHCTLLYYTIPLLYSSRPCDTVPSLHSTVLYLSITALVFFTLSHVHEPCLTTFVTLPVAQHYVSLAFDIFLLTSIVSYFLPSTVSLPILVNHGRCTYPYNCGSSHRRHRRSGHATRRIGTTVLDRTAERRSARGARSYGPTATFMNR